MKPRGGAVLVLASALLAASHAVADTPPAFLCGPAKLRSGKAPTPYLSIADRFGTRTTGLTGPALACWSEAAADDMLAGYRLRARGRKPRRIGETLVAITRLGRSDLTVKTFTGVLVPSSDDAVDPATPLLSCYAVRGSKGDRKNRRLAIADAAGERLYDVGRPTRLCVPSPADDDAPALVCHVAKLARTAPLGQARSARGEVTLTNRFGTGALRIGAARELCLPTLVDAIDPPPPPGAPFTLQVLPAVMNIVTGTRTALTATAHHPDHDVDLSDTVVWSSSNEDVARVVVDSTGGAFASAVGQGTATITATDPATGVRSADTGGDATITVTWALEKLTLSPHWVSLQPGEHEGYTVTGHFAGGGTRNLTQKVIYASSNPAVAVATNQPDNRSRVQALAAGTTVISATDPISGITTTQSLNDATLRVVTGLSYLSVRGSQNNQTRFVGESKRYTATGVFADGTTLNMTQRCEWSTGDPSIAVAPNTPGDLSRIDAVAPGETTVACKDPISGKSSPPVPFWVLGELQWIQAWAGLRPFDFLRTGQSTAVSAYGHFEGGGSRSITQDVVWATRDPELLLCPNEPGDRSRVVALDGGDARVFATDPASGVVSNDTIVTVLGDLLDLRVEAPYPYYQFDAFPVGVDTRLSVRGIFENGTLNLSYRNDYTLESSNPDVATIVNGRYVRGMSPGTATITAHDLDTGIASAPLPVTVVGGLESITLTPATSTRGIGEWESFTAIGHFPPGFTRNMTQDLVYTSSDPSVAVADTTDHRIRSRIRTVGAGTATITATDQASGVSASAVLTVLPGTIERVTIEPAYVLRNPYNSFSFTAIGHYPDGTTINVTQVVTWDSLVPDVATATNEPSNRSRIYALRPGVSPIVARHPGGVSSHDTGDDATFEVKPLVGLTLSPEAHIGSVGQVEEYTLIGTFDDASTINLTQDAYYWTDDAAVARADNPEGDRSKVLLLAPGTTTVRAAFAHWFDGLPTVTEGSVAGAFLTVDP